MIILGISIQTSLSLFIDDTNILKTTGTTEYVLVP